MGVLKVLQGIENAIRRYSKPLVRRTSRLPVYTIIGVLAIVAIVYLQCTVSTIFPRSVRYKISLGRLPLPNVMWCLFAINIVSVYFFNDYYLFFVKISKMRTKGKCDKLSKRIERVEKCTSTLDYLDVLISKIERLHKRMLGQLDAIRITFIDEEVMRVEEPIDNNNDDDTNKSETLTVTNDQREDPGPDRKERPSSSLDTSYEETDSENAFETIPDDNNIDYFITQNSSASETEPADELVDEEIKFRMSMIKKTNDPINVVNNVIGDLFNDFDMPMILEVSETETSSSTTVSEKEDGGKGYKGGKNVSDALNARGADAGKDKDKLNETKSIFRALNGSFSTKTFTVDKIE